MTAEPTPIRELDSGPNAGARRSLWGRGWLILRAAQVRLRFVAVLAAAFLVVGQWDTLLNRWERLTRTLRGGATEQTAVSNDTEYFCPMDPGVVSDWPGKCGACNMALVRRKRGEAVPLPSGVVARMQISPYRLQLAGVRTSPVAYRPLALEARLVGIVLADEGGTIRRVEAVAFGRDLEVVSTGRTAEVVCDALPALGPFAATVTSVGPADEVGGVKVGLDVTDSARALVARTRVTARVRRPVADVEPFRSLPADPPPPRPGAPRSVWLCPDHAEVLRVESGRCPVDGKVELEAQHLLANQRVGWWCPMHPQVTADRPGETCRACNGMALVPRVVTYRPRGEVLAVAESAVVDTGAHKVVYVERMPGMFDGVEVVLGPRCGESYPVVRGLEPGQRVAIAGAFLIDAETRLNPGLASAYFGASRGGSVVDAHPPPPAPAAGATDGIEALAKNQALCPVTRKRLGSMGPPVAVTVEGRVVLVCCDGCVEPLRASPAKYLAKPGATGRPDPPAGGP
jgi:hypothetical protein